MPFKKLLRLFLNNDLNGILDADGHPMDWTSVPMTNQPSFNALKIRKTYEILTLLGVAYGSLTSHLDRIKGIPFINPLLRPVHGLSEIGVSDPKQIHTPVWIMFAPSPRMVTVDADDFRHEIVKTSVRNGGLDYIVYVCDKLDTYGDRVWEAVGTLHLQNPMLTRGVDQNLLFPHDSLRSSVTGQMIKIPEVDQSNIFIADDIQ